MEEISAREGWSPIRPIIKDAEKPKEHKAEQISDFEKRIEEGDYKPVPDPSYIWIQKHCKLKIVNTRRGINREYSFWPLKKELMNSDKKAKKEDSRDVPDKCRLYMEYREDGQVHVFLRKYDLGKSWTAADVVCKIDE